MSINCTEDKSWYSSKRTSNYHTISAFSLIQNSGEYLPQEEN